MLSNKRWIPVASVIGLVVLVLGVRAFFSLNKTSPSPTTWQDSTLVSGALSGITASLSDSTKAATSTLTLGLTTASTLPAYGGKINAQFNCPSTSNSSGFDLYSATLNSSTSPSSLSVYSRYWNGITLSTNSSIAGGTAVSLVIDNIKNPTIGGKCFAHVWTSNYSEDLDGSGNWGGDYNSSAIEIGSNTNVTGTITDANGAAVPFAYVSVYSSNWSKYYYGYTDKDGVYGFADVAEGTYNFDLNYYASYNTGKSYFPPDRTTISVASSGVTTKNLAFLAATKSLTVKVRKDSTDGSGASNASVYLYRQNSNGWASKNVDSSGNATFELTGGTWSISLSATNWPADWAWTWSNESIVFVSDSSSESKEKTFVVDSTTASISGTFAYPDGSSITNQWLSWLSFSNTKNQYFAAQFDSYGNFRANLTAGSYSVNCGVSDQNYTCPKIENFTVVKDEAKNLGTLKLVEKKNAISGRITAGSDNVVGASVSVWSYNSGVYEWGWSTTASDGTYTIKVAGGTYSISAWPQWKEGGSEYVYSGKSESITVTEGTVTKNFEFKKATNTLNITLTDPAGNVLSDFYGWVSANDGAQDWGYIGASIKGSGSIRLPKGTWDIQSYIYDNSYSSPDPTRVTFAGDNESQSITLKAVSNSATIKGTVKDEKGNTITGSWVSIYATRGKYSSWYSATFDSTTGQYSMKVASGNIRLSYWVDQNTGYSSQSGNDNEFNIKDNETKEYDIILRKADSQIKIEAVKPDGSPMQWAWITADTRDPKEKRNTDYYYYNGGSTDNSGKTTLKVPAGTYFVGGNTWYSSGYINPKREKVTVSSDKPADIKLVFRISDGTISGNVLKEGGASNAYITAWGENGGYAEGNASNSGEFSLAVSKGDKWHVRAILDINKTVYKSKEVVVDLTGTDKASQNLELVKQNYILPEGRSVTFDPRYQQTVVLADGTTITIPANSMGTSGTVTLTAEPTAELAEETDAKPIWYGYELKATNDKGEQISKFSPAVTIETTYTGDIAAESKVLDEKELIVGYYDEAAGTWVELALCTVDVELNKVTCQTDHFTKFAIIASTDTIAPAPPSKITVISGDSKASLGWTNPAETDFAGVNIYRSTKKGFTGTLIKGKVTGNSYDDLALTNDTAYYYLVRSIDVSGNESTNSTQLKATPGTTAVVQIEYLGDKLVPDDLASFALPISLPTEILVLIFLLIIFDLAWRGRAMWLASKNDHMGWFTALLIFSTAAILPILYIYVFSIPKRVAILASWFWRVVNYLEPITKPLGRVLRPIWSVVELPLIAISRIIIWVGNAFVSVGRDVKTLLGRKIW